MIAICPEADGLEAMVSATVGERSTVNASYLPSWYSTSIDPIADIA